MMWGSLRRSMYPNRVTRLPLGKTRVAQTDKRMLLSEEQRYRTTSIGSKHLTARPLYTHGTLGAIDLISMFDSGPITLDTHNTAILTKASTRSRVSPSMTDDLKHHTRCAHRPKRTGSYADSSCGPCDARQGAGSSCTTRQSRPGGGYRRSRWST